MKKISTFLLSTALAVIVSVGSAFAQPGTYYPNYFINQTFDGMEAFPNGWTWVSSNAALIGHAAATYAVGNGVISVTAGGSGTRGGELRFPSTASSPFADSAVWVLELDWTVRSANWNAKQANGIIFMGPNSQNVNDNDTWYGDAIFGLYCYKNDSGYVHFWNKDPQGPKNEDGTYMGPVIYNQNANNSYFLRSGANNSDWAGTDSLNLSTRTKVRMLAGTTYRIYAEFNFETQKIQEFRIVEVGNEANGDTILNTPFLAPWMVGNATTVEPASRVVTALDRMVSYHTRSGGSGALDHTYDNWKLYTWKESVGIADVEVQYVDQDGNQFKTSRVMPKQQVLSTVWLELSDKDNYVSEDGSLLYYYDEAATHAANLANPKGGEDGESIQVDFSTATTNVLKVVFKKVTKTEGTYVWKGAENGTWNYLENNFSVAEGPAMSYQEGNPVAFSDANVANKTVTVVGDINLADASMTISAEGYEFDGTGRIFGTDTLYIDAPVTLGADNRMAGGAVVTADSVYIKHVNAATSFALKAPETKLVLEAGATFNKPITGSGFNSVLDLELASANEYSTAITNVGTINITQKVEGNLNQATWRMAWNNAMPDSAQVNVYNGVENSTIPNGFGVTNTALQRARVYLGPNTRLVRQYNENANNADILYIGELTGDATSRLESGFVDGRFFTYDIGGLNTDAEFDGTIGAFTRSYAAATDTTEASTVYAANGVAVTKSGTGTWTTNGNFLFPEGTRGSQVNVAGGTFIINGDILFPNTDEGSEINVTGGGVMKLHGSVLFVSETAAHKIDVTDGVLELFNPIVAPEINQLTLTVDTAGILKTNNVPIGAYNVVVSGVVQGGGEYTNSFALVDENAVLKLRVNSFDEGAYESVKTQGDLVVTAGTIDIWVGKRPSESLEIQLFEAGNFDIIDNVLDGKVKILVNGEDITANSAYSEVPEDIPGLFYFDPEMGTLGYLFSFEVGLDKNTISKEIKHVEYFNVLGQKVYHNNDGYTLQKITYTDGSVKTVKVFNKTR